MRSPTRTLGPVHWIAALALGGCALLGKSAPSEPRFFTPEFELEGPTGARRPDLRLRLGEVTGWSHLRERMVRSSDREFFYDEGRRWAELPEVYLRRALSRALFEEHGLVEAQSGREATLDVELIAFEEIDRPRRVRFQALLSLRDDRLALLAETVSVERPIAANPDLPARDPAQAAAEALSQALREGVTRIADRVLVRLGEQPSRPAGSDCRLPPQGDRTGPPVPARPASAAPLAFQRP